MGVCPTLLLPQPWEQSPPGDLTHTSSAWHCRGITQGSCPPCKGHCPRCPLAVQPGGSGLSSAVRGSGLGQAHVVGVDESPFQFPVLRSLLLGAAPLREAPALGMSTVTFPATSVAAWQLSAIRSGVPGSPSAVGEGGAAKGQPRVVRAPVRLWGDSTGGRQRDLEPPGSREPPGGAGREARAGPLRCPQRPHGGDVRPCTASPAGRERSGNGAGMRE